jgi:hypothetical protein
LAISVALFEQEGSKMQMIPGRPFFDGCVILTGTPSDISHVVGRVPASLGLTPEPSRSNIALNYLGKKGAGSARLAFQATDYSYLQVCLYQTDPLVPVRDTMYEVHKIGRPVFADPNYLIMGDLWSPAGDPWSTKFDLSGTSEEANALFWEQWAWGEQGIRLLGNTSAIQQELEKSTGQGIHVGIFDTSPFEDPGEKLIDWMLPNNLNLQVSHPYEIPVVTPPGYDDCRDHGLFVAGLVHAVAPASEIHLIRVFNEYALGDLFTLIQALHWFIEQSDQLDNTIINLSLGADEASETDLPAARGAQMRELAKSIRPDYQFLSSGVPVMTLETVIHIALECGAVIAAAAGNDSYAAGPPEPAQTPASYPDVIGVAASNMGRELSCYSNAGDVAAPGGDGGPGNGASCVPRNDDCVSADCPYGLISLVNKPSGSSSSGYAYWVGTSFATPLASGLAARLREQGVSSDDVRVKIIAGVQDGIIDLPTTLL